jgi:hypothetical protein
VHGIAYAINAFLGNVGRTVDFVSVPASPAATITTLANAIKAGSVKTLVVLGGNPVYNAPADLEFEKLLGSVSDVVRYGYYVDETSAKAGTHIAAAHYLESWGDARTVDGTIVPVQPMILPLFGGLTELEVLARILSEPNADPYALVSETITGLSGGNAAAMQKFLHDGLLEGSAYAVTSVNFNVQTARALLATATKPEAFSKDRLEVRFVADHKMDDGRFANNGWLQECPDPITKISWDNAILVSPRLAKELKIEPVGSMIQVARKEEAEFTMGKENARVFDLTVGGRKITGPVHIQPGLSNYTVIVPLGYGRGDAFKGRIGANAGFSAYPLRTSTAMHVATGTLADTGKRMLLANTQEHWSMEGRDIIREANLDEVKKADGPGLGFVNTFGMESHSPPVYGGKANAPLKEKVTATPRGQSLYENPNFDGVHQWGMSVGHVDRHEHLHRLQHVRRRVPGREQRADRR